MTSMENRMLRDRYGRTIEYLRLSVTDRCDLRCTYCMPTGFKGFEEPADWLTFDEIERLLGAFARLGGEWRRALREWDGDLDFHTTRPRAHDERMPWDHFEVGVKKAGLLREWDKARVDA
jgi:hypothetical protein